MRLEPPTLSATPAQAARFGFADDEGKYADDGGASFFEDAKAVGATENRITVRWDPKRPETILEQSFLDQALPVAKENGIRVVFHVFPISPTSLTSSPTASEKFAAFLTSSRRRTRTCATSSSATSPTSRGSSGRSSRPQGEGSRRPSTPGSSPAPTTR